MTDPVTDMPGVWCPESSWEELTSHGVTPLTETQFMLRHVEDVLRQHLDMFLGVQEAEELIVRFTRDAQVPEIIRSSLANARERLLFARVLRALARERVPLTAWTAIAAGVQAAGWSTVPDLVREIRLRLETQLPGNETGTTLVRVPREWLTVESGSTGRVPSRAGISAEAAHRMLIEVREWLLPHTAPVALVTADAAFRPMVRRLIEFEFPTVPVLQKTRSWRVSVSSPWRRWPRRAFLSGRVRQMIATRETSPSIDLSLQFPRIPVGVDDLHWRAEHPPA